MERQLAQLVDRMLKVFGGKLVSVTLYGSAADGSADSRFSDLNVFCVLTEITARELADIEPVFRWWREAGNLAPLLMTEAEAVRSADSFPIEFSDMKEHRRVLYGRDVIAGLAVDRKYHRAQVEHELRAKLLRLRQQATAALADRDALLRLCLDSVSTFCVLGRHALKLAGHSTGWRKHEIAAQLADAMETDMSAFVTLLDARRGRIAPQELDPDTLFGKYLGSIQQLINFVDQQENSKESL